MLDMIAILQKRGLKKWDIRPFDALPENEIIDDEKHPVHLDLN